MSFVSGREFKLWDYNVSHKQLLLRSPQSDDFDNNIDVIFWGVECIQLSTLLVGIELRQLSNGDMPATVSLNLQNHQGIIIYQIISGGRHLIVACSGCKVLRNSLDMFDSSLYYFGTKEARGSDDLGDILYHS